MQRRSGVRPVTRECVSERQVLTDASVGIRRASGALKNAGSRVRLTAGKRNGQAVVRGIEHVAAGLEEDSASVFLPRAISTSASFRTTCGWFE